MSGDNYGIQHNGTGGIVNQGTQAFGPNSTAIGASGVLDELRELLAQHGIELSETQRADADAELSTVRAELDAPSEQRDRGRIVGAMRGLTAAVGSVTALAGGVEKLWKIVEQFTN
jgi:hypothetical protein